MENKEEKIEKEIEKTLEQFDIEDNLTPDPYFYSKIKNRLENRGKQEIPIKIILKPALLILLIIFNITTIFWYTSNDKTNIAVNQQNQLMEVLSGDLNIDQTQQNILFAK